MKSLKLLFKHKSFISTTILVCIVIVAAVLRLYQLGNVPTSPDWDEASLGYNAYSILQTGKDEYGKPFPIVLQSFGDYKPALYIYLAAPSVALFGLNTFAVRFPSAIFGILTVFATYFLVYELFKRKDLALLSAFLLAISPWHIQFSRVAFEANVGVALNVFALLFFLKGLKKPIFLTLSAAIFGLSLYIYQSQKVFTPLFVLLLLVIFRKDLFAVAKKYLLAAIVVGLVVALPMITLIATDKQALARAKGVSVFSAQTTYLQIEQQKYLDDKKNNNKIAALFHNKYLIYGREVIAGYVTQFDLKWLFLTGDSERHHAPGMGLMYLWELPFLLLGLYILFFGSFPIKSKLLIFLWFLLVPVPASVTFDIPHAVRTMNFLPTFQIFVALGLIQTMLFVKNQESRIMNQGLKLFAVGYILFAIFNFVYYLNQYFVQQNYFYSESWQYGYKEAVAKTKEFEGAYDKVVISNKTYLDQSYIFYLFYLKYPPSDYQKNMQFINGNETDRKIGKYEFRPIEWSIDKKLNHVLFIGMPSEFPADYSKKAEIHFLDGKPAIEIVGT